MPGNKDTCARCGSTPATLFHCDSGTAPAIALCDDCLATAAPWKDTPENHVPDARCDYCGASPCSPVPDTFPLLKGASPDSRWMCPSCSDEYNAMIRTKLRKLLQSPPAADPMVAMARIEEEMERHMKRHVALRHN